MVGAAVLLLLIFLYGAWTGSFIGLLSYRLPRRQAFGRGRSQCESCGRRLNAIDLLPVFGWLARRGKCHYCGNPIPRVYLFIEFMYGAMFLGVFLYYRAITLPMAVLLVTLSLLGLVVITYCASRIVLYKLLAVASCAGVVFLALTTR